MNKNQDLLNRIVKEGVEKMSTISEADFSKKPMANKWSKKEILGHLIDSAHNNHLRFLKAVDQSNLIFQGYAQEEWVRHQKYQQRATKEMLELWKGMNIHIGHAIAGISSEKTNRITTEHNFHKICMNPLKAREPTNLSYLIRDYIYHLEHHLNQIIPNYKKMSNAFKH